MNATYEQLEIHFPDAGEIVRERRRPWGTTELARVIGCSRFKILKDINAGLLEARRVGARFVIDPAVAWGYYESTLFDPRA